jgi:hypothetical protein
MKPLFIKAIRPQSVDWIFLVWLLMGSQWAMAQAYASRNAPITKLCPGGGRRLFYTGRSFQIRETQTCPEGRQFTLYLVPQGEPLTAGIEVGSAKEAVQCSVIYSRSDTKNYREPTMSPDPPGRFDFRIPANLPAHLLNRPVELRFGDAKPNIGNATFANPYIIDPAKCL